MKSRALLVCAALVAAIATSIPAHAEDPICTIAAGSADNMHVADPTNDYTSLSHRNIPPLGDLSGDGADLTGAWIGGAWATGAQVHVQVAALTGMEFNDNAFVFWTVTDANDKETEYYISAGIGALGPVFDYGRRDVDETTGAATVVSLGTPTGSIVPGTPGEFVVNLRKTDLKRLGISAEGVVVSGLRADTDFLVGSTDFQTGEYFVTDDESNADFVCEELTF
jgi:hypothetical protein